MRRKALKMGSIFVLKRYENYNNSPSSVKLNLAWVGIPPGVPNLLTSWIVSTYPIYPGSSVPERLRKESNVMSKNLLLETEKSVLSPQFDKTMWDIGCHKHLIFD